ncbi:MAG: hypothetical protein J6Q58_06455, partial [Clostridia bacterium]|nr:hypothetical protein [Clostridia bacterium]
MNKVDFAKKGDIILIEPLSDSVVETYTDIQKEFINLIQEKGIDSAIEWLAPMKNGKELSHPISVRLAWSSHNAIPYILEISENKDFNAPYVVQTNNPFFILDNLKVGQKYYWRVNNSEVFSFKTANNLFRFIKIDGALNVRDVGGINIKQGLLYRGSEINDEYKITQEGKRVWTEQLKIKSELNVRKENSSTVKNCCVG